MQARKLIPRKPLPWEVTEGRIARSVPRWLAWCFLASAAAPMLWGQAASTKTPAQAPASDALPTADQILERYVEVTGGQAEYEARTSEITHATVTFTSVGIQGELTEYAADGNYRSSLELPGLGTQTMGVSDGIAWETSDLLGPRIKEGVERADAVREAIMNEPIWWRETYQEVSVSGIRDSGGEPCYEVVMVPAEGAAIRRCYSVESGLALETATKAMTQMGELDSVAQMSEYKDFGGILAPSRILENAAGQQLEILIQSVDVNQDIPDEVFALPEDVAALVATP